uniref:Uncharacterized protein n=1 Tax=Rhizophora mucronata TaxID=61149 RepID=A0A2P2NK96_RHIMU
MSKLVSFLLMFPFR